MKTKRIFLHQVELSGDERIILDQAAEILNKLYAETETSNFVLDYGERRDYCEVERQDYCGTEIQDSYFLLKALFETIYIEIKDENTYEI